ncbi:UNC93-like protein MFSD11 [Glossina fuscipes]|uniref:UNC93-like protein MFSD11 n=1 Tax=Glossina fuscipes TaxID=7396 RepID=A0A9C5ZL09_9MUSC|nr:UNC93-like protein MFSD11 [Glossina fuscipes]
MADRIGKIKNKKVRTSKFRIHGINFVFNILGLELSFFSGIYRPSVGFTEKIHETPKEYVGIIGICIGIGGMTAGTVFGILGSKTARFGRNPIVITAYVIHLVAFFLIYLNLPDNAPFKETEDVSYIDPPKIWLALLCALMLGLGDVSFNTQIYSMLAGVFVKQSAAAFAIFKFTQSVAAAIAFFYAYHLGLGVQLGILVMFATFGTITFRFVELKYKQFLQQMQQQTQQQMRQQTQKMQQKSEQLESKIEEKILENQRILRTHINETYQQFEGKVNVLQEKVDNLISQLNAVKSEIKSQKKKRLSGKLMT